MSVDTITNIRLGHGGGAYIAGTYVPATSGNMENSVSVQYSSGYYMPNDTTSRSRILHSDGTVTHTGSVSFDLTTASLGVIKNIIGTSTGLRGVHFNVSLCDGVYARTMTNCYATSITMNGSPSGVLGASINFMSASPSTSADYSADQNTRDAFTVDLIPYWWSGNSYVRDWTFTYTQNVVPKFCNSTYGLYKTTDDGIKAVSPTYLFIGEIDVSLDFTTFCPIVTDTVNIYNSAFSIIGRTTSSGYTMGGANDLGTYKYNIASHASLTNDDGMLYIGSNV